jgi:hypothetical protein
VGAWSQERRDLVSVPLRSVMTHSLRNGVLANVEE